MYIGLPLVGLSLGLWTRALAADGDGTSSSTVSAPGEVGPSSSAIVPPAGVTPVEEPPLSIPPTTPAAATAPAAVSPPAVTLAPGPVATAGSPARAHVSIGVFQSFTLDGKDSAAGNALFSATEANLALHLGQRWILEAEAGGYYASGAEDEVTSYVDSGDELDASAQNWTGPSWSVALGLWQIAAKTGKLDILVGARADLWGSEYTFVESEWVDEDENGVGALTEVGTTVTSDLELRASLGVGGLYWLHPRFAVASGLHIAVLTYEQSTSNTVYVDGESETAESAHELDVGAWPAVEIGVRFVL